MTWTFCTSGAATAKAGASVSTEIKADETALNIYCDQAEGMIEIETKTSFVNNYSSLTSGAKYVLSDVCSSEVAKRMIGYDMSGYTSRQEAGLMIDLNDDIVNKGLARLKQPSPSNLKTP